MDFVKNKDGFSSRFGRGLGLAFAVCVFLAVSYLVSGKAGFHNIDLSAFVLADGILFALAVAAAALVAACRRVDSFSLSDFAGGFRHGFADFGHGVSYVVNFLLLSVVYVIGVGAVSLLTKAFGKKYMDFGFKKSSSYYTEKNMGGGSAEDYLRQF